MAAHLHIHNTKSSMVVALMETYLWNVYDNRSDSDSQIFDSDSRLWSHDSGVNSNRLRDLYCRLHFRLDHIIFIIGFVILV